MTAGYSLPERIDSARVVDEDPTASPSSSQFSKYQSILTSSVLFYSPAILPYLTL